MGDGGSCSYLIKPVLVLMIEFSASSTSEHSDVLPLNATERRVYPSVARKY